MRSWRSLGVLPLAVALAAVTPAAAANHLDLMVPTRMINDRVLTLKAELRDPLDRVVWQGCNQLGTVTLTRVSDGSDIPLTVTVFDNHLPVPDNSIRFYGGIGTVSFTLDGGTSVTPGDAELTVTLGSVSATKIVTIVAPPSFRTLSGTLSGSNLVWGPNQFIRLTGTAQVNLGSKLVIHPGTLIMVNTTGSVDNGTLLRINGEIEALGTQDNPIAFFSERGPLAMTLTQSGGSSNANAWQGIHHSNAGVSRYEHVILTGAGNGQVLVHPRPPVMRFNHQHRVFIENSVFADNNGMVFASPGNGHYEIRDSVVSRCGIGAEFNGDGNRLIMENVWITSCGRAPEVENLDGDLLHIDGPLSKQVLRGLYLSDAGDDGLDHSGSTFHIENSIISDVRDGLIRMDMGKATFENVLVYKGGANLRGDIDYSFFTASVGSNVLMVNVDSVQESILWPNTVDTCIADVDYTIVGSGASLGCGTGNLNVNPQFENTAACDYRPKTTSPALTAGPTDGRIGWLDFPEAQACSVSAECDDERSCSTDTCQRGVCTYTPIDGCECDLPGEVTGLTVNGKSPTTLAWTALGAGVEYDLASGSLDDLRADQGVSGASCLDDDLATASASDARGLPAGEGYYYIVRGQSSCGSGTYGRTTWDGARKPLNACP